MIGGNKEIYTNLAFESHLYLKGHIWRLLALTSGVPYIHIYTHAPIYMYKQCQWVEPPTYSEPAGQLTYRQIFPHLLTGFELTAVYVRRLKDESP